MSDEQETRSTFNGTEVHVTGGTHYVVLSLEEVTADAESGSGYAQVLLDAEQSAQVRYALELAESAIDPNALYDEEDEESGLIEDLLIEVSQLRALIAAMTMAQS